MPAKTPLRNSLPLVGLSCLWAALLCPTQTSRLWAQTKPGAPAGKGAPLKTAKAQPLPSEAAVLLFLEAEKAFEGEEWPRAAQLATRAIAAESRAGRRFQRAHFVRGQARDRLHDYHGAVEDYRQVTAPGEDALLAAARRAFLEPRLKSAQGFAGDTVKARGWSRPRVPLDPAGTGAEEVAWDAEGTWSGWVVPEFEMGIRPAQSTPIHVLAAAPQSNRLAIATTIKDRGLEKAAISLWSVRQPTSSGPAAIGSGLAEGQFSFEWPGKGPKPQYFGHYGRVAALAFSPGGTLLASGGIRGGVTLWDGFTGEPLRALRDEKVLSDSGRRTASIIQLAWRREASSLTLLALDADATLYTWRQDASGEMVAAPARKIGTGGLVTGEAGFTMAAFSHQADMVAIAGSQGAIALFSVSTGARLALFHNSRDQEMRSGFNGVPVSALAFSPTDAYLASANFRHIYLNDVPAPGREITLPAGKDNRLSIAGQAVGTLQWLNDTELIARSLTELLRLNPQKILVPGALRNAALAETLAAPALQAGKQPVEMVLLPALNLLGESVPAPGEAYGVRWLPLRRQVTAEALAANP